ncbi:MAG: hypothetical protein U0746_07185 [Gemmataceae bacterium]
MRYYLDAGAGVGGRRPHDAVRHPRPARRPVPAGAGAGRRALDWAAGRSCGSPACAGRPTSACRSGRARGCGYHAGLLSLGALKQATEDELIAHCRRVAEAIPLVGFYLQPAAGGRVLPYSFWRRFAEIGNVVAIKVAPFNRYQTLDVVRAVAAAGRSDIALLTGNDDNIVLDLLTPYRFAGTDWRIRGGLLGQWAVWTRRAVELVEECHRVVGAVPADLLRRHVELVDANAAVFDAANGFAGCIAGVHEVLRRQGLLEGVWCLDPAETLGPGQAAEIDRVCRAYPHLTDDEFVRDNLGRWLSD